MYNYYIVIIDLLPMFVPVLELVLCVNIVLFSSIYPIPKIFSKGLKQDLTLNIYRQ